MGQLTIGPLLFHYPTKLHAHDLPRLRQQRIWIPILPLHYVHAIETECLDANQDAITRWNGIRHTLLDEEGIGIAFAVSNPNGLHFDDIGL